MATPWLPEAALLEVAAACKRLDVETSFASLEQLEGVGVDILIGGLSAGRRVVPDEYLSFVSSAAADASLLLLCEEALVRPFVSLSEGRITLIGPNCEAETLFHRLRVLLAARAGSHGSRTEQAGACWWVADSRGAGGLGAARSEAQSALTLAFDLEDAPTKATDVSAELDADLCLELALSDSLGADTGVLHLAPSAQEWVVCWPQLPGTLWLLSPLRFPPLSDLSVSHGGRGRTRLAAASGDIVLALAGTPELGSAEEIVRGASEKAQFGGPSVFDAISARLPDDAWVSVVEVR